MEESKTLVEQLREMVVVANEKETYPAVFATPVVGHAVSTREDDIELFTAIADRIEREYMPRPRFEDGEPVQFGDVAKVRDDMGEVCEMKYQRGKCVEVTIAFEGDSAATHYMIVDGERVKRPEARPAEKAARGIGEGARMSKIMKLGDIHDMERYLSEDCYCPGEIYDMTGFFYQVFSADDECVLIEQSDGMTAVVATSKHGSRPQAIMFWHDDDETPGHIIAAQRVDATENNIGILRSIVNCESLDGRKIDEFKPGSTAKSLKEIARISDIVIRD